MTRKADPKPWSRMPCRICDEVKTQGRSKYCRYCSKDQKRMRAIMTSKSRRRVWWVMRGEGMGI